MALRLATTITTTAARFGLHALNANSSGNTARGIFVPFQAATGKGKKCAKRVALIFTEQERIVSTKGRLGPNLKFACPCCDCFTLAALGDYEICPVCFWEEDGDSDGGNGVTLEEARANYRAWGVSELKFVHHVRRPLPEELP